MLQSVAQLAPYQVLTTHVSTDTGDNPGLEEGMRSFLTIAAALAVSVFGLTGAASGATTKDSFGLKGEVYAAGFKIEMKNAANRKLTSVKAGTYQIKIEDKATIHNFRLSGPGVNKATAVPRKTETIWTVRLKRGTYTFLCDPHANNMRGTFRVA